MYGVEKANYRPLDRPPPPYGRNGNGGVVQQGADGRVYFEPAGAVKPQQIRFEKDHFDGKNNNGFWQANSITLFWTYLTDLC